MQSFWEISHLQASSLFFQAPLCNVKEMKFTKIGNPFVLDFIPKVDLPML